MTTFSAVARRGGGWLLLIGVATFVGALSTLVLPTVLGRTVDAIVAGKDYDGWLEVAAGLILLGLVVELVDGFAETISVAETTAWLRNRLIRHLLVIGPVGSHRFNTDDLVSRVCGNAVDAAQEGPIVVTIGTAMLPPIGSLVLLFYIDIWVAVAFIVSVALVALMLRTFAGQATEVNIGYLQTQGRIAARLVESLAGARTIAAAGTVQREKQRVLEQLHDLHEQGKRRWLVLSRTAAQVAVVGPLIMVVVLAAGGLALLDGRISAGELFAAIQYAMIGAGFGGLADVFGQLAQARVGASRIREVLAVDPVAYGQRTLPDGPGSLEFRKVTVRAGDAILLDGVDLVLPGGAAVALVGRSDAGGSTFVAIAARLRDPDEGQVMLDGVPLTELSHQTLRAAVSGAFECPVLVGETVADAIGLGRNRDWVQAAAQVTHAHDFISRLPQGYDTLLAEAPMSRGEVQRLSLARAWGAGRLLVFDNATSRLDVVTDMQISQTLVDDHRGRTRLIATRRMSAAARADLVVWLEDGRVRAVGPHQRLWNESAYRKVFE